MELPTKDLLFRYTPSPADKANYRYLADEYAVYANPDYAHGIAGYERHGEAWLPICELRPVLAQALRVLARMQPAAIQRKTA